VLEQFNCFRSIVHCSETPSNFHLPEGCESQSEGAKNHAPEKYQVETKQLRSPLSAQFARDSQSSHHTCCTTCEEIPVFVGSQKQLPPSTAKKKNKRGRQMCDQSRKQVVGMHLSSVARRLGRVPLVRCQR
jgi:hypothetical protein